MQSGGRFKALHNKVQSLQNKKRKLDTPKPAPAKRSKPDAKPETSSSKKQASPLPKQAPIKSSKNQANNTGKNNASANNNDKNNNNRSNNNNKTAPKSQAKNANPAQNKKDSNIQQRLRQRPSSKFFELLEREGLINQDGKKVSAEEQDDIELRSLAKKLNMKGNKLSQEFKTDDLLGGFDGKSDSESDEEMIRVKKLITSAPSVSESDESEEEGEDGISGKAFLNKGYGLSDSEEDVNVGEMDEDEDSDEEGVGGDFGEDSDEDGFGSEEDDFGEGDDSDEDGYDFGEKDLGEEDEDEEPVQPKKAKKADKKNTPEFEEDIYGRLRNVKTKELVQQKPAVYVPPQRAATNATTQLTRQVKGHFNKLSPANVHSIVTELEKLFRANSKNEMTSIVTDCILSSCLGDSRGIASLAVASISVLSCLIDMFGNEIGGHFLETLTKRFDESYKAKKDRDAGNAILVFVQVYNFGLVHCVLIYDLIKMFISNFSELDVELILTIVQNAGTSLRKDDPGSLKEIVLKVLERAKQVESKMLPTDPNFSTSRMKFMVEAITDLKNNKAKPPATAELIPQLKRGQRTIVGKRGGHGGELKITYDELVNVETRGRWWVVGSGWTGNLQTNTKDSPATPSAQSATNLNDPRLGITVDLLALAAKQKMNTDVRRAVFCILMSSDDYVDAITKLIAMGVKSKTKDIVFYAQVASHLCTQFNEFKFSLQVGFYQKLKNLSENELKVRATQNLAQFLAHVVGEASLSIMTIKAMPLTERSPLQTRFLDIFLVTLFSQYDEKHIFEAFKRLVVAEDEEADRVAKEIAVYLSRLFDVRDAITTFKEVTKLKPPQHPVNETIITKRIKLAQKVMDVPIE